MGLCSRHQSRCPSHCRTSIRQEELPAVIAPDNDTLLWGPIADFITSCMKLTNNQRLTLQLLSVEPYVSTQPAYMLFHASQLAPLDLRE